MDLTNKLVGRRMTDFQDQKTGQQITGVSIYFLCKDDQVSGWMVDKKFFKTDNPLYPVVLSAPLNCEFTFSYGPKGRVLGFDIVNPAPDKLSGK